MDVIITHTADSATIKFSSSLDQGANDESWGISDVIVEYYGEECAWGYDGVPTTESLFGTECLVAC